MHAHGKPSFAYSVRFDKERAALSKHLRKRDRAIPQNTESNLLIASWNLTNFGVHRRRSVHLRLMAEVIRRFDVVAVQEVADDIAHLGVLLRCDLSRASPAGLTAELAMHGYEHRRIHVHLYWSNVGVRELETEALWRWAKARVKKRFPPNDDIILIGDFNMPRVRPGDRLYDIAKACGAAFPKYTTDLVGTNLAGDADYDQVAFFPNKTDRDFTGRMGVVDFDNALFADLYEEDQRDFYKYVRYYIADHRPLWAEFER